MKCIVNVKPVVAIFLSATLLTGFVAGVERVCADSTQTGSAPTVIQSVLEQGDGATAELIVVTSAPATYTSYKTSSPHRLVVDFSQAIPAESLSSLNFTKGAVKSVTLRRFDTDAGVLTRMEIFLSQDIEPVITPSTGKAGELRISFPGYKPVAVETSPKEESPKVEVSPKSTQSEPALTTEQQKVESPKEAVTAAPNISSVPVISDVLARGDIIEIRSTNPIGEYKSFRLNKPERVVVDLLNAKVSMANKLVQLNVSGVSTARVGSYSDKVRVVFDSINGDLPEATFNKTDAGLAVRFGALDTKKSEEAPAQAPQPAKLPVQPVIPAKPPVESADSTLKVATQIAAIDFQVVDDVSRVTIKLNGSTVVDPPVKSSGVISFKLKNVQLPRNLQRSLDVHEFTSPILRVTPVQIKTKSGTEVQVRVALKSNASFSLRQEADLVHLDVKHPENMPKPAERSSVQSTQKASPAAAQVSAQVEQIEKMNDQATSGSSKFKYSGRKVTLEFADAEVRKIFQLLSEVSNKNFVLGDEVTGTISLKLVNVPWDQALDIILDTKGLDKREDGTIILIRGKGKFKSLLDEELEIRKSTLKSEPLQTVMFDVNYADLTSIVAQFGSIKTERGTIIQDQRTNKIIIKDVKSAIDDMRKMLASLDVPEKQVMIEARIVEASSTFTQSLGINWGIHYRDGSAAIAGINSMDTNFGGLASTAPTSNGVSGNPGAAAGISFGTLSSNIKLDLRLNAAVSAGLIRIVSTPRVATLNHKSAKITQGQQIPYTSSTSDKVETKFVEAALALEVTPHINPNGTVVMKIDAKNDSPGSIGSPPPINKKQATTEMMLRDGETTVIGGIYVESDTNSDDGVPYLKDVPWLGGLFKSNDMKRSRNELLIFITPRIISAS
mgnify:CR=1 FL=1